MANPELLAPVNDAAPKKHTVPHWKRKTAHWSRWLHIYLSMASFGILFFFAATGIKLNHQDRFTGEAKTYRFSGVMNTAWLRPSTDADAAKQNIVGFLRKAHGLKAALSDYRMDDRNWRFPSRAPAMRPMRSSIATRASMK